MISTNRIELSDIHGKKRKLRLNKRELIPADEVMERARNGYQPIKVSHTMTK